MAEESFLVRIVDDDADVRDSLSVLLSSRGWDTAAYAGPEEFLRDDNQAVPGAVLLDVRMGGMSGLELQRRLLSLKSPLPIIFMSAYGELKMAVGTLKLGAVDFLQKPVDIDELAAVLADIRKRERLKAFGLASYGEAAGRLERLSERERAILRLLSAGPALSNAAIAGRLGVSERTAEGHRARLYRSLQVHSAAGLEEFLALCRGEEEAREALQEALSGQ